MKHSIISLLILLILLTSCNVGDEGEYYTIRGFTQGTTYHITYQHPTEDDLKGKVDTLLRQFDLSLSSYEPASIISVINRNEGVNTDSMFRVVFRESARIYQETGGAFDITLGPVINAWGFGPGQQIDVDSAVVDSLLRYVGMDKVVLVGNEVKKRLPEVTLNVNAIAQGYSVDVVTQYLDNLGCINYMVEIGGEIRTKGKSPRGSFWRIGVDRPEYGNMIPGDQLQVIITMHNWSLATSGNYRKFYEKDGVRITHSIDPATGYPRASRLLSATILTDDCMTADAYATSCMVMGLEKAKEFIEDHSDADAYLIYGGEDGTYQVWYSENLRKYIEEP
ncbi:MAG: FAD:protein FMN transferase [Bacteroidetes bacterium]|nr:FAD:protein FMN transferase [Bacteroidota bacterium]